MTFISCSSQARTEEINHSESASKTSAVDNLKAMNTSSYIIIQEDIFFKNKAISIPQLYSISGQDTAALEVINKKIIDRFNLIPNAPKNENDYTGFVGNLQFFEDHSGYLDIKSTYKKESNFVEVSIEGNYVEFEGKPVFEIYQTYKKETFFIDIENNEVFNQNGYDNGVYLKYFFEPKEYLALLSNTWIPRIQEVKKKYPDDIDYEYACEDCSSSNVSLHPFAFEFKLNKDSITFFLASVEYYRDLCYNYFCSPQLTVSYPTKDVTPMFKKDFDLSRYEQLDQLSKIVYYKEHLENKQKGLRLISGEVNDKYPFLMVLNISNKEDVTGHYMYLSNHKFLELKGHFIEDKKIEIVEYLDNKSTGKFDLIFQSDLSNQFQIRKFIWSSPDGETSYEVKANDLELY